MHIYLKRQIKLFFQLCWIGELINEVTGRQEPYGKEKSSVMDQDLKLINRQVCKVFKMRRQIVYYTFPMHEKSKSHGAIWDKY